MTTTRYKDRSAIDDLGYAIADARRYHAGELTGEFTVEDVYGSIKTVLRQLMDGEPTDEDAQAVLDY